MSHRDDLVQTLTEMFVDAGKAHSQAFIDTGGADEEWPLWYAEHLVDKLNERLHAQMTKSELCYLLVAADRELRARAPGADWHAYYARYFVDRYTA